MPQPFLVLGLYICLSHGHATNPPPSVTIPCSCLCFPVSSFISSHVADHLHLATTSEDNALRMCVCPSLVQLIFFPLPLTGVIDDFPHTIGPLHPIAGTVTLVMRSESSWWRAFP